MRRLRSQRCAAVRLARRAVQHSAPTWRRRTPRPHCLCHFVTTSCGGCQLQSALRCKSGTAGWGAWLQDCAALVCFVYHFDLQIA